MKVAILLVLYMLLPGTAPGVDLDEAIQLYEMGQFRQAKNVLQQLKSTHPEEAEVSLWLGKTYIKMRQWKDAVREMEKAVQLQPSNAQYHLWLGRAYGARASHSIFITAIRWARRVVKEFETARQLDPEDLGIRFDLMEFYLNAPGMIGGGKDKAEAEALAISKLEPARGYTARAIILQKEKNWELAEKELTEAAIQYPNDADAWKDLAEFLLERKEFKEALVQVKKSLALESKSKKARLIEAAAQTRLKQNLDEAVRILEELAAGPLGDDDPAFEEVYYWLGECFRAKGDNVKARKAFLTALSFNPEYDRAKESISKLN